MTTKMPSVTATDILQRLTTSMASFGPELCTVGADAKYKDILEATLTGFEDRCLELASEIGSLPPYLLKPFIKARSVPLIERLAKEHRAIDHFGGIQLEELFAWAEPREIRTMVERGLALSNGIEPILSRASHDPEIRSILFDDILPRGLITTPRSSVIWSHADAYRTEFPDLLAEVIRTQAREHSDAMQRALLMMVRHNVSQTARIGLVLADVKPAQIEVHGDFDRTFLDRISSSHGMIQIFEEHGSLEDHIRRQPPPEPLPAPAATWRTPPRLTTAA